MDSIVFGKTLSVILQTNQECPLFRSGWDNGHYGRENWLTVIKEFYIIDNNKTKKEYGNRWTQKNNVCNMYTEVLWS